MKEIQQKIKDVFINGAISPKKIADSIAHHQTKVSIGAHEIFLGQVRADNINDKTVGAIEYSAYKEMANKVFHSIREDAFEKYELTCMHIYHSLGRVKAGELCLFVFVSSAHRSEAMNACRFVVEEIKSKAPVFGKEIFEDDTYVWKVNK